MLRQEINLYAPFETHVPAAHFLTFKRLGYCLIAIAAFFIILYLLSCAQLHFLQKKSASLQNEVAALKNEFATIRDRFPALFFSDNVELTVSALQQELSDEKKLLQSLASPTPFSKNLVAFSSVTVPDVWLTEINIGNRGYNIVIKGKTISMENLQQYIKQIMTDSLLSGYVFNVDSVVKIEQPKDKGNLLFELSMKKIAA